MRRFLPLLIPILAWLPASTPTNAADCMPSANCCPPACCDDRCDDCCPPACCRR